MPDELPGHLLSALEQLEAYPGADLLKGNLPPNVVASYMVFILSNGDSIRIDNGIDEVPQVRQRACEILNDSIRIYST